MSGKICDRPAVSHITEPDATHTLEQQGPSRVSFIAFCQCLLFHVCRFIFLFILESIRERSANSLSLHPYWGDVHVTHKHRNKCLAFSYRDEQQIPIAENTLQTSYEPMNELESGANLRRFLLHFKTVIVLLSDVNISTSCGILANCAIYVNCKQNDIKNNHL